MNKRMKVTVLMLVSCLVLAAPMSVFAATAANPVAKADAGIRAERLKAAGEGLREKAKLSHDEWQERILSLFARFAPELAEAEADLMAEHTAVHTDLDAVHAQLKALREDRQGELKDIMAPIRAEIRRQVDSGELTPEEAREALQEARIAQLGDENLKALKEELQVVREAIKAQAEVRKGIMETLRAAVKAQDAQGANTALSALHQLHTEHLTLDEEKLEILLEILSILQ